MSKPTQAESEVDAQLSPHRVRLMQRLAIALGVRGARQIPPLLLAELQTYEAEVVRIATNAALTVFPNQPTKRAPADADDDTNPGYKRKR